MNIFLIDRNIVSDIRKYNKGGRDHDFKLALSIDKSTNFVSPLMSIIEGSLKQPQSMTNMHDALSDETNEIGKFYKQAKTDALFLQKNSFQMIEAFSEKTKDDVAQYAPLVKFLQRKLADPVPHEQAKKVRTEILDFVVDNFYYPGHPIVVCGLACLHGNIGAQKVLKPNASPPDGVEKHAYNALLDLLLISQLAYIRSQHRNSQNVRFLTRDKGLQDFLSQMKVSVKKKIVDHRADVETVSYDCTYHINLFPNILNDNKKYSILLDEISILQRKIQLARPVLRPLARSVKNTISFKFKK
ncbi:hypothetical protein [Pseudoduganella aquatica]|uniref:Uncharacterized protein n=1 Tax=Pseudoduganella aquatica TaxID=2660641 RepID=A0A7X4KQ30_9BURK|nr:hypothetical protein [Pseudoduganella aquatica]MYN10495.1 hypothetical protein [Pseudoduganella aquatica]